MQNRFLTLLALTLTLSACSEDAKDGENGTNGTSGTDGADGTDGTDGTSGTSGADGLCSDASPVEITGLTGMSADALDAFYPSDEMTVESNAAGALTYTVAGYGLDYAWDGDSFTVTPTTEEPSSQVIVATDGCTTATYEFSVDAEIGLAIVNIIHLYDGAPSVDVTMSGDDLDDAILTDFSLASETGYLDIDAAPYTFDLWVDGVMTATLPTIEFRGDGVYSVVVYSDAGLPTAMLIEDDISEVVTEDAARVTATHVADGVGQVDVWETVLGASLFTDIDYSTSSAATDIVTGEYTLGIDADDDGVTDYEFQSFDMTGLEGAPVNVFAYMTSGTPFLFVSAPWYDFSERILPDPIPAASTTTTGSSTPDAFITQYTWTTDIITIADACNLVDLTVNLDMSHTYIGDVTATLSAPDGTAVDLHAGSGGSADDIIGSYAMDGTGTLTAAGDLNDFLLLSGAGDWTLDIYDSYYGDDGTLNSWDITLGCL